MLISSVTCKSHDQMSASFQELLIMDDFLRRKTVHLRPFIGRKCANGRMKPAIDGFLDFDTNTTLFIHVRMNNLGFIFQSHKWIQHTSTFHRNYNTDKQK